MDKTKIEIKKDGPYMVKNLKKLTDCNNNRIDSEDISALCRCGKSRKKPFCDGTHQDVGFNDKKVRTEKYDTKEYQGKDITVVDNIGICSHAGECVKGSPDTFFNWDGEERISNPDNSDKEKIIETIKNCPSGSLSYKIDSRLHNEFFSEEEVFVSKDGPLHIRGGVILDDPTKEELISKEHYTLCRCGASKNKPFCDGMHKKVNFKGD